MTKKLRKKRGAVNRPTRYRRCLRLLKLYSRKNVRLRSCIRSYDAEIKQLENKLSQLAREKLHFESQVEILDSLRYALSETTRRLVQSEADCRGYIEAQGRVHSRRDRLADAELAYNRLRMGQSAVRVRMGDGSEIEFTASDANRLKAYVDELRQLVTNDGEVKNGNVIRQVIAWLMRWRP